MDGRLCCDLGGNVWYSFVLYDKKRNPHRNQGCALVTYSTFKAVKSSVCMFSELDVSSDGVC